MDVQDGCRRAFSFGVICSCPLARAKCVSLLMHEWSLFPTPNFLIPHQDLLLSSLTYLELFPSWAIFNFSDGCLVHFSPSLFVHTVQGWVLHLHNLSILSFVCAVACVVFRFFHHHVGWSVVFFPIYMYKQGCSVPAYFLLPSHSQAFACSQGLVTCLVGSEVHKLLRKNICCQEKV